jgi:hypothetical protein
LLKPNPKAFPNHYVAVGTQPLIVEDDLLIRAISSILKSL